MNRKGTKSLLNPILEKRKGVSFAIFHKSKFISLDKLFKTTVQSRVVRDKESEFGASSQSVTDGGR